MAEGKLRQSNYELYRILCITLIVFMHSCSGVTGDNQVLGILVNVLGNIGVTGFVLLSGFFGIRLNVAKLVKLDILMICGGLCEALVNILITNQLPSTMTLVKCFIPFISHRYWFLSAYFALCILSPFINDYLDRITEETHRKFIFFAGFLYLVMPTVFFFDQTGDGGKGIVNMVLAYIIGRYIGIYKSNQKLSEGKLWGYFGGVVLINCLLNLLLYKMVGITGNYYARDNSLLIMVQAVLLLFIFMQQKPWINVVINQIAAKIVAVYVLEDSVRMLLMYLIPQEQIMFASISVFLYMALIAVGVIVLAILLETIRRILFGKLEDVVIKNVGEWIKSWKKQ